MVNAEIRKLIPTIQKYFLGKPVEKAWLFGSCSRGEEKPLSDIDILVRYENSGEISLLTISGIISDLGNMLGRKVDVVEDDCLLPFARESVDNDKILIYERTAKR